MANPTMSFTVKSKLYNLETFQKKIQVANLSKATSTEFARILRREIRNRVSGYSTGTLARNVKEKKVGRYGYGVYAPYYVWYANYGRRPGLAPGLRVKKIDAWAERAGIPGNYLRQSIADFGTKRKLFYESTLAIFKNKRKQIYKDEFKKLRKR